MYPTGLVDLRDVQPVMSIKPLPRDVVAQIKSSAVITSLNNVVCGLIKNSLDADSTKINLSVDYSRGNCSVEDNGTGIPPSEFKEDGGLGHLHYTSKYPPRPDRHGRHGVFLASVASLSLFSVTSHHRDFHSHNSMSILNSKVMARHVPCRPEQRILTFPHGTRVSTKDLFGSMPVRVKHRALHGDKSSFSRNWDQLLSDLVALVIAWPGEVSLSIREVSSRQIVNLRTGSRLPTSWLNDGCRLLHQASLCDSPHTGGWVSIGASAPGISIEGYVCREPVATRRVQFISLGIEPLSNEFQCNVLFEEVNKVFADSAFGVIDSGNDSDSLQTDPKMDSFTGRELKPRKGVDRWPMFFLKINLTTSVQKGSLSVDDILDDRQPDLSMVTDLLKATFYEFLKKNHCRPRPVILSVKGRDGRHRSGAKSSRTVESKKTKLKSVMSPKSSPMGEPCRKSRKIEIFDSRPESPFDTWSRIKSGNTLATFKQSTHPSMRSQSSSLNSATKSQNPPSGGSSVQVAASPSRPPLYDANGKLTRKPFDDLDPKESRNLVLNSGATQRLEPADIGTTPPQLYSQDQAIEWINPATKLATLIDHRTGFALPPKPLTLSRRISKLHTSKDSTGEDSPPGRSSQVPWTRELVNKWKNPVFELTERPIPKLSEISDMLGIDLKPGRHNCNDGLSAFSIGSKHEASTIGLPGRLSKDALSRAELIAQVDTKFILVKVPSNQARDAQTKAQTMASSSLVLIDQHAADERCRVESLMKGYFVHGQTDSSSETWQAATEPLPKPLFFELSAQDKTVLCRYREHFAYWGICYDVEIPGVDHNVETDGPKKKTKKKNGTGTKARVAVQSLPPAVRERCRTEPRLLADLIRTEAWKLNDEAVPARRPLARPVLPQEAEGGSPAWVSLFHGCPQGIAELINSRSCRSAIMFNDPLTRDQCAQLVGRLTQCVFPFQCAHGRPSMVPLVDLGGGVVQMGKASEEKEAQFGRQFKQWKQHRR